MARSDEVAEVIPSAVTMDLPPIPDDDALRDITSYEDAVALSTAQWGEVLDYAEEFGTGFAVLEDKSILVNAPFHILAWRINDGNFGTGFATLIIITPDGGKWIVNDGSTGIFEQVKSISQNNGRNGGVTVTQGLRVSPYATCPSCDRPRRQSDVSCPNVLGNGTMCGDESEERHQGATYYLAN